MNELSTLLRDESFQRWLAQTAESGESKHWDNWLAGSKENQRLHEQALEVWELAQFSQAIPSAVDAEWSRLRTRLELHTPAANTSFARKRRLGGYTDRPERSSWKRFGAITAVGVLLAVAIRVFFVAQPAGENSQQDFQVLTTDFGQRVTVTLPDETRIILNANSTLKYPVAWQAKGVNRFELEGEAYFDVTPVRDPDGKFVIHTADGAISVVGTEFAVYERGQGTRVVVARGRVGVVATDTASVHRLVAPGVLLAPGQLLKFRRGSRGLLPDKVDVEPYTTWWHNQFVLVQTPFAEIVQRLEETYGVDVRVADDRLLQRTLSGSIENQNIVVVTDAIAEALRVRVRREGQVIFFGKPTK